MKEITVEEIKQAIDRGDKFAIVDVRTATEFNNGHIAGSINLPLDVLRKSIKSIVPDKNTILYTYCLSGSRSSQAVDLLESLGYLNVYSMKNGLLGWRVRKFPLERK